MRKATSVGIRTRTKKYTLTVKSNSMAKPFVFSVVTFFSSSFFLPIIIVIFVGGIHSSSNKIVENAASDKNFFILRSRSFGTSNMPYIIPVAGRQAVYGQPSNAFTYGSFNYGGGGGAVTTTAATISTVTPLPTFPTLPTLPQTMSPFYGGGGGYQNFYQTTAAPSPYTYSSSVTATPPTICCNNNNSTVLLGATCLSNTDCASIKSSMCINGLCACVATTSTALSNIACVPRATAFGDSCVITAQCVGLDPLASCYLDRCVCESIYHVAGAGCAAGGGTTNDYFLPAGTSSSSTFSSLSCLKKQPLNQTCCNDRQCSYEVWNSQCKNGLCSCVDGYTPIGTHACAAKASALGGACAVNTQCMHIAGAVCSAAGTCVCNAQDRFVTFVMTPTSSVGGSTDRRRRRQVSATSTMMMCLPAMRLGQACTTNEQCSARTANAICVDSFCTCGGGFLADPSGTFCQPKDIFFSKLHYTFQVSCCGNSSLSRFVGQVCPDTYFTNVPAPYTFSITGGSSTQIFTIDTNGVISSSTGITATTTLTATVTYASTLTDTTTVTLVPESCCLTVPTVTASTTTYNLQRNVAPATPPAGPACIAGGAGAAGASGNTFSNLFNVRALINSPCGELVSVTGSASTAMAPSFCTLQAGGQLTYFTSGGGAVAAMVPAGMSGICTVTVTASACNGATATSTLSVTLNCPA